MVESVFESFFTDVVNFLYALIPQYILPNLQLIIQVVVLLVVAFVVGKVIKVFAVKILNTIGLKRMTSRSWAESMLKVTGYRGSIVELIGDLVKWLIYILFLALIISGKVGDLLCFPWQGYLWLLGLGLIQDYVVTCPQ